VIGPTVVVIKTVATDIVTSGVLIGRRHRT
jgi:hypothetical protein